MAATHYLFSFFYTEAGEFDKLKFHNAAALQCLETLLLENRGTDVVDDVCILYLYFASVLVRLDLDTSVYATGFISFISGSP